MHSAGIYFIHRPLKYYLYRFSFLKNEDLIGNLFIISNYFFTFYKIITIIFIYID